MGKIRFIHVADLHLDTPFQGLKRLPKPLFNRIKNSTFHAFEMIVDIAIKEKVDFLIISGDLYDEENRSLRAQFFVKKQMERLNTVGIDAFIIHGNHDHLNGQWAQIDWPGNVHFFKEYVENLPFKKDGKNLAYLYGFSYPNREVTENMTSSYKKQEGATFHIGLLHGNIEGSIEHQPYAPFKIQELVEKEFDYWALGHIHKREILHENPYIIYSGNIQGRHPKEQGDKGGYLVELTERKQHLSFFSTANIIWEQEQISINDLSSIDMLIESIELRKKNLRGEGKSVFLNIELIGKGVLHSYLYDRNIVHELLDLLNEEEESQSTFVWVVDIKVNTTPDWNRDDLKKESNFIGDLIEQVDQYQELNKTLSSLYQHRKAKKFLSKLTEAEEKEILEEAESLILNELLKE